jgi:serine-type D-Ala-D-Ala carboxypeptidase/endopeptidase (penicillin-binding protein 4)
MRKCAQRLKTDMLKFLFLCMLILFFGNSVSADEILQGRLSQLLPREVHWALVAVDLQTGREVASAGSARNEPLVPASLVKLFTAGAVLDHGGLDLRTTILHDGKIGDGTLRGNLYILGRGNALLSTDDLHVAARRIVANGIMRITGSIVADDSLLDPKGLERSRTGPGYAPAGALGLDLHTIAVVVTPAEPKKPPKVSVEPPDNAVRFAVEAKAMAAQTDTIRVTQIDDTAYRITGNISVGSGTLKWRFALYEPALYAAGALKLTLAQAEVEVEGNGATGKAPKDAELLAEIEGPDLRNLIREMNVNSLNVVADNLLLLLGAEKYGASGTREKGVRTVLEFLSTLGLPKGEATIGDGSGLSSENRATVGFMALYLRAVTKKPWFESFRSSLPRAGMEGTVRDIGFKDERFRVKSGRLEDVYALAGYGVDARGREVAFAFIVNAPGAAALNLDKSGAEVMKYLGTEVRQ